MLQRCVQESCLSEDSGNKNYLIYCIIILDLAAIGIPIDPSWKIGFESEP